LEVRISTYEFWENTNTQVIEQVFNFHFIIYMEGQRERHDRIDTKKHKRLKGTDSELYISKWLR
jgi:hypothetical protein